MKTTYPIAMMAALGLLLAQPALAEDAHHKPPAATQGQASPPASAAPATPQAPGMMRPGGMPMMGMMHQPGAVPCGDIMPGCRMASRVEGQIAFLRAELRINDSQAKIWDDFAAALRANAKALAGAAATHDADKAGEPTLLHRLHQQESWYAARLQGIRAIAAAFEPLHAVLSEEQRKAADELLGPYLGLSPAAGGMMPMRGKPRSIQ